MSLAASTWTHLQAGFATVGIDVIAAVVLVQLVLGFRRRPLP